jgi:hypothetical protein
MTSRVEICNLALIEARYDETIESLSEKSVAAQRCKRIYDTCRRELLSSYPGVFATKFVKLARASVKEVEGASYAYEYPSQALRVVNVFENEGDYKSKNSRVKTATNTRVAYVNGGRYIVSDYAEPFAEIIVDEQVEENFPPLFVRLLYLEMSLRLAKLAGADRFELGVIMQQIQTEGDKAKVQSLGEDDNHLYYDDEYYIKARG